MAEEWRITVALSNAGSSETLRASFPDYRLSGDDTSAMAYADSKERAGEIAAAIQGVVPSEVALTWWDATGQEWRPIDEYGMEPDAPETQAAVSPEQEREGGAFGAILDTLLRGPTP